MSGIQMTNIKELGAALKRVMAVTKKTEAEIVNKALKDVAFRSAQYTPKTTASEIKSELKGSGVIYGLAAKSCNKKYGARTWTKPQFNDEVRLILQRRTRGVNALRAGWIPAIRKMGGTFRGANLRANGTASEGLAKPATIEKLEGWIQNSVVTYSAAGKASGAGEIIVAVQAINRAVQSVIVDRLQYAEKKLKEANRDAQ